MDTIIVIGGYNEIEQSIACRLCGMGFKVYALDRRFPEDAYIDEYFIQVPCDRTNVKALTEVVEKINREENVCGIIIAGQFVSADPFELMPIEDIDKGIALSLISPLVATRIVLPNLISNRGSIFTLSPNTITSNGQVVNLLVENALKTFSGALFSELRNTGVKTCHILLQNNLGEQDSASKYTKAPQSRIQPEIVADTIEMLLRMRENNALTQIVLRPQATREKPYIPISSEPKIRALQVIQLPETKNFPPVQEPILSQKYKRPEYAPPKTDKKKEDEFDDRNDDYVDPELRYLLKDGGVNSKNQVEGDIRRGEKNIPVAQNQERAQQNKDNNRSLYQAYPQNRPYHNNSSLQNNEGNGENGEWSRNRRRRHRKHKKWREENRDFRNPQRDNLKNEENSLPKSSFSNVEDKSFVAKPVQENQVCEKMTSSIQKVEQSALKQKNISTDQPSIAAFIKKLKKDTEVNEAQNREAKSLSNKSEKSYKLNEEKNGKNSKVKLKKKTSDEADKKPQKVVKKKKVSTVSETKISNISIKAPKRKPVKNGDKNA